MSGQYEPCLPTVHAMSTSRTRRAGWRTGPEGAAAGGHETLSNFLLLKILRAETAGCGKPGARQGPEGAAAGRRRLPPRGAVRRRPLPRGAALHRRRPAGVHTICVFRLLV